jgi:hypothetical protein
MMRFHELSSEAIASICRQIESLINAFSNRGRLGKTQLPKRLSLFESCQEMILDVPKDWADILRGQGSDLIEQWRRPRITWYHQLRTTNRPFGFARSIEVDGPEKHRVIEVVPSAVAQEFQKAIRFIDSKESKDEPSGSEPTAVLLHVPRYAFYGLAIGTTEAEGKVSLAYPFFRQRLGVAKRKLERESLIPLLESLPTAFGVLGAVEPKLEPEPTPEKPASSAEGAS